ncbi:MAG: hypothetical protein ACREJ2_00530 [Planctomycetota bacterium]
MKITAATILRKREGVVSRSLEDARIALRLDSSETLVFNRAGDRVWALFDGRQTVAEVAAAAGIELEPLQAFAADLVEMNLFEALPASANTAVASASASAAVGAAPQAAAGAAADDDRLPRLIAREQLAVLGGCTASGLLCSFPSSGVGNGASHGKGPPTPPPGLNK